MSPRREKLTSPQTRIALARGNRPAQHLLPIPEPVDTEAARRLFHRQRRTAVRTVALLSLLLFGMSGVFALWPQLTHVRPAGVPLSWALLVAAVYPLLFLLALWHVRSAEKAEARAARAAEEHTASEHASAPPPTRSPSSPLRVFRRASPSDVPGRADPSGHAASDGRDATEPCSPS